MGDLNVILALACLLDTGQIIPSALSAYSQTTILGASASVAFVLDPGALVFGFTGNLSSLDLQGALASMGIKVDLGPLQLQINQASAQTKGQGDRVRCACLRPHARCDMPF